MIDKDKINIGDRVNVFFGCSNAIFNAEILYEPQNTGDSWILKSKIKTLAGEQELIYYVQQFERMDKL